MINKAEDTTTNLVFTFTRKGDISKPLTVAYAVGGSASLDTDYRILTSTPGRVTFAAGSATATVIVDPLADTIVEPDETVSLTLVSGLGYALGTNGAIVGTILNDDLAPPPPPPPARRYFYGGAGPDRLTGTNGPDWLEGRRGRDVLTGRQGGDIFAFSFGDSTRKQPDHILDFQPGDRIRVTGLQSTTVLRGPTVPANSKAFAAAFQDADASKPGAQPLRGNQATLVRGPGTNWLVVNDANPKSSDRDLLIQITGNLSGGLSSLISL